MILKYWNNETSFWTLKDGFSEIRHRKTVDEEEKTVTRSIQCFKTEDTTTMDFCLEETKLKQADFTLAYILNDNGSTIERIN